jgi:excisionase family DNA binding protein
MDEKVLKPNESVGLMDVKQVAEYLNIKESTVYNLSMRSKIPHLHIGKKLVRFRKDMIDKWLSEGADNGKESYWGNGKRMEGI